MIAGLTVGVILVPQGMAYALLAGMPPIYGLYGGLIPLLIYAIFGSSRRLSIGPVAIDALLILAGISQLAEPLSAEYVQLVLLSGLMIGVFQVMMGLFRLGFLVNFLSHPVVLGFTSAAAVIIAISQLKDLLGIQVPRFSHIYETARYVYLQIAETNLQTLAIGVGGIILLLIFTRINKRIPAALITMILGILVVRIFDLDKMGIAIIGEVPSGLPGFKSVSGTWADMQAVLPTVLTVCFIGIVESISIAKYLESTNRDHTVRPNQELMALGLSKVVGSFFQAIPTSASFTRSAVNNESGAKSQLSAVVSAILIGLTLLFLTPLFFFLPKAILAAVILVAVRKLFHWKEALRFWKVYPSDFLMMLTTFVVTLLLGIQEGVLSGVCLSIVLMVYRSSRPHVAELGMIPGTTQYRNVTRFPDAIQYDDILILRFDAPLYFGNAAYFKDTILRETIKEENLELVVLDASSMYDLDSTGIDALIEVIETIRKEGKTFFVSGALGPVRDRLHESELSKLIGPQNQFLNVHQAVQYFRTSDKEAFWKNAAIQTNVENL